MQDGDINREAAAAHQRGDVGEKDRHVAGMTAIDRLTGVGSDEEGAMMEGVGQLFPHVGRIAVGVEMDDLHVVEWVDGPGATAFGQGIDEGLRESTGSMNKDAI